MKQNMTYIGQLLQAMGRIIGNLALLHYGIVFWSLRLLMLAFVIAAGIKLITDFAVYRLCFILLAALGILFIVRSHELVTSYPVSKRQLITKGPFSVVRHPMYSGCGLVAIGCAGCADIWPITVLTIPTLTLWLSFCCAEDEENAEIFGEAYLSYKKEIYLTGIIIGLLRRGIRASGRRKNEKN